MEEIPSYMKIVESVRRPGKQPKRTFEQIGQCSHCGTGTIVVEEVKVSGKTQQAKKLADEEDKEYCFCNSCGIAYVAHVVKLLNDHRLGKV